MKKRLVFFILLVCFTLIDPPAVLARDNHNDPAMPAWMIPYVAQGTAIFGEPEVTETQMVAYIQRKNPTPNLNCQLEDLVRFYYEEASLEGIRPDLAICQAIKETGFFAYGGDVVPEQNNYCGLGTTGGGVKGAYFTTPREGVRAQIQHLLAYASTRLPFHPIIDPRYDLLKERRGDIFGKTHTWEELGGRWAVPGVQYGEQILAILADIKKQTA